MGNCFSYLEGRKYTEILGVALSTSFIVSSGVVKSIGFLLWILGAFLNFGCPLSQELYLSCLYCFYMDVRKIPKPTKEDIELRSERVPMNGKDRKIY